MSNLSLPTSNIQNRLNKHVIKSLLFTTKDTKKNSGFMLFVAMFLKLSAFIIFIRIIRVLLVDNQAVTIFRGPCFFLRIKFLIA